MGFWRRWIGQSMKGDGYRWRFARVGGVDQVIFRGREDFEQLPSLDLKLWMALCMPTRGIALDSRTAELLDTDKDGFIRPPELLAAVQWCTSVFADTGCLIEPSDRVELSQIRDPQVLAGARRILKNLKKPDAGAITLADVTSQEKIFADTRFNGDGVIPSSSADQPEQVQAIEDIVRVCGGVPDRSGKVGLDAATLDAFIRDATLCLAWVQRGREDPSIYPLSPDATASALNAVRSVRAKVDDFFTRCRLAAYDERAGGALNGDAGLYAAFGLQVLSATAGETADLPLAHVAPGASLPLRAGMNPAWSTALEGLYDKAVKPLLGQDADDALTPADWAALQARLAAYASWQSARPATAVMSLGEERLQAMQEPSLIEAIRSLIAKDSSLKEENAQIEKIEKMIRFRRDLYEVLTNYVNFSDFYGQTYAVFQAGSLYLDARACHLCIEVSDPAKHAALAGLSNAYLAYCDIRRGALQRSIVAVVTDGDSHNIAMGRNGVFFDRDGKDWSATITRVVSNPISVREAFWMPYRKLVRLIEEQIEKRAQAAETASMNRMTETANKVATVDQTPRTSADGGPKKIELGTIALIGTAIGGISALVGGFLQVLFGLGFWLPVGVLGIVLLISGPSMFLAAMKLKQRNLGPVLDANGWAINTRARMNPAFGAALTELARLPPGSERSLDDPYARRSRPVRVGVLLAVLFVVFAFWWRQRQASASGPEPSVLPSVAETVAIP